MTDAEGIATKLGSSGASQSAPPPLNSKDTIVPEIELGWRNRANRLASERNHPVVVDLPSGMKVQAIRASLRWLFNHDRIPDPLLASVEEMILMLEKGDPDYAEAEMTRQLEENQEETFAKFAEQALRKNKPSGSGK